VKGSGVSAAKLVKKVLGNGYDEVEVIEIIEIDY